MASKKRSGFETPKGFRKVETGIAGFWKPTSPGQFIVGIVGHAVETKGTDGRPNVYFTFKLADDTSGPIETGDGKVVESEAGLNIGVGGKTLQTFLQDHVGQPVWIAFRGLGAPKKGQNAPKLYDAFERDPDAVE
jgi:hypothetical protein